MKSYGMWETLRLAVINTFLTPLRWLRDLLARLVERAWVR
jgi:hypothetical protein